MKHWKRDLQADIFAIKPSDQRTGLRQRYGTTMCIEFNRKIEFMVQTFRFGGGSRVLSELIMASIAGLRYEYAGLVVAETIRKLKSSILNPVQSR